MSVFVDIHVLQTLPPSNPNRDDTGAPKTATFGGVQRMRISSQAIKRATREDFEGKIADGNYGVRTKKIAELVARSIVDKRPDLDSQSVDLAEMGLKAIGFKLSQPRGNKSVKELEEAGFLVFLSAKQIEHVADALISVAAEGDPAAAFKELKPRSLVNTDHSIDIALFGRMVAEPNALNVDAACQVAHAIGVGAVEHEYDYYTAVDDEKKRNDEADEGAGMIGTIEFASATLYRYATINVDMLRENLGDDSVADRAIELFVDSFVRSMPTGKITTFANRTLPRRCPGSRCATISRSTWRVPSKTRSSRGSTVLPSLPSSVSSSSSPSFVTSPASNLSALSPRGPRLGARPSPHWVPRFAWSIWEVRRWMLCEASNEFGTRLATGWPHAVVGLIQSIHAQIDGGFSHEKRTGRSARGGAGTQAQ